MGRMKAAAAATTSAAASSVLSSMARADSPDRYSLTYLTAAAATAAEHVPAASPACWRRAFPLPRAGVVEIHCLPGLHISASIARPVLVAQFPVPPPPLPLPLSIPLSDKAFAKFWAEPPTLTLSPTPEPPPSRLLTLTPSTPVLRSLMCCPSPPAAPASLLSACSETPLPLPLTSSYLSLLATHASFSSSHVASKSSEALKHALSFPDAATALDSGHAVVTVGPACFSPRAKPTRGGAHVCGEECERMWRARSGPSLAVNLVFW
jgi:hypothetical protein